MRFRECDKIIGCGMLYDRTLFNCPHCNNTEIFSNDMGYDLRHYIYDIETYPLSFTMSVLHCNTLERWRFEISYRQDDRLVLFNFLNYLAKVKAIMIGFNNNGFDYPVLHDFIRSGGKQQAKQLYDKAQSIIDTPWNDRYDNVIWDSEKYIAQLDLMLIHHFDNASRRTSLKQLEFAMRSHDIQDLPYVPGSMLSVEEIMKLLIYNDFDVDKTFDFYKHSLAMIEFREGLSERYDKNFINHNDAKIGKDITIMKLGDDLCFNWDEGKKKPNQTPRPTMALSQAIFPYVQFKNPEFQRIHHYLYQQVITETKGVFKELSCTVDGLVYVFGTGGLHASVPGQTFYSNHEFIILDVDVTSFYPALGIVNNISPEHLGDAFPMAVSDLKAERLTFPKGTLENAAYKLAMNAGFGNSNSEFTPFFDPLYTMKVTINGQLLLCMLAEWLLTIKDLKVIQGNTDGLTVRLKRCDVDRMRDVCHQWEQFTKLDLEEATYSRMFIRDVNNYIAEYDTGKLKNKGVYAWRTRLTNPDNWHPDNCRDWHKDHSALIVPMAVEAALIHGEDVREFITGWNDPYDFMMFVKAPGGSRLELGGETIQNRSRYYVTTNGLELKTVSPPTGIMGEFKKANGVSKADYAANDNTIHNPEIHTKNKSAHETRYTGKCSGWLVTECNNMDKFNRSDINFEYYIQEAVKLVEAV